MHTHKCTSNDVMLSSNCTRSRFGQTCQLWCSSWGTKVLADLLPCPLLTFRPSCICANPLQGEEHGVSLQSGRLVLRVWPVLPGRGVGVFEGSPVRVSTLGVSGGEGHMLPGRGWLLFLFADMASSFALDLGVLCSCDSFVEGVSSAGVLRRASSCIMLFTSVKPSTSPQLWITSQSVGTLVSSFNYMPSQTFPCSDSSLIHVFQIYASHNTSTPPTVSKCFSCSPYNVEILTGEISCSILVHVNLLVVWAYIGDTSHFSF